MTITNGYATLDQFKAMKEIRNASYDSVDDAFIERTIERKSRLIDEIFGKWFYAHTQTRYFDVPRERLLKVDRPLLTVTTLTNGDGTTIAGSEFDLHPKNGAYHYGLRLKALSTVTWQTSTTSGGENAISVAGTWGAVDRTATDPESMRLILATEAACLSMTLNAYQERRGNIAGNAQVTSAGVVITPLGAIPKKAWEALAPLRERI